MDPKGVRGYKCDVCEGTLIGTNSKDPRIKFIGKHGTILMICRGCLEKWQKKWGHRY